MNAAESGWRTHLNQTFSELCQIQSPSGNERRCADYVIDQLGKLGIEVVEDDANVEINGNCGNLFARIAGESDRSVFLCAHLDTVHPAAPIEPVVVDDHWENKNDGILGADNKAAVAVLLELAARFANNPPPVGIELLFTVSEENGLRGARHFDLSGLNSEFGYVFDHATPLGQIIIASPTYYQITADFHGKAAHAGIRPEEGRSAILAAARAIASMGLGRLDKNTTANVGKISGGTGVNVVPEFCRFESEVRSVDRDEAERIVSETVDQIQIAANVTECDVNIDVTQLFAGYVVKRNAPEIQHAQNALTDCGFEPELIFTGGGSDANAFRAKGFACVNIANGTENNHEPNERVGIAALEGTYQVVLALLDKAAETN